VRCEDDYRRDMLSSRPSARDAMPSTPRRVSDDTKASRPQPHTTGALNRLTWPGWVAWTARDLAFDNGYRALSCR
jgi:hypothetical protein